MTTLLLLEKLTSNGAVTLIAVLALLVALEAIRLLRNKKDND